MEWWLVTASHLKMINFFRLFFRLVNYWFPFQPGISRLVAWCFSSFLGWSELGMYSMVSPVSPSLMPKKRWLGLESPLGGCSFSYKRYYINIYIYITICIAISLVRSQQMVVEMPWLSPSKSPCSRSVAWWDSSRERSLEACTQVPWVDFDRCLLQVYLSIWQTRFFLLRRKRPALVKVILVDWISKLLGFWSLTLLHFLDQKSTCLSSCSALTYSFSGVYPSFRHIHILLHCSLHIH